MADAGRYIRYQNKTAPCERCLKSHGVLSMRFSLDRAVEDAASELAKQIEAEVLAKVYRG